MGTKKPFSQRQPLTPERERPSEWAGCRCGNRWLGRTAAHCGACHLTFTTVGNFDLHRRGGACQTPADVGLEPKQRAGWVAYGAPDSGWRR